MIDYPWMMSMGTDTPQLALEGEWFEDDDVVETLFNTYADKMYNYVGQRQVIDEPLIMGDAFGAGTWEETTTAVFKNTGSDQIKFENSVYVDYSPGGRIYRTFDSNRDFSKHNIASIWFKREAGSSTKMQVTFYTDVYPTRTNGYRFYPALASSWTQTAIAKSGSDGSPSIVKVESPTGWDKIRSVVIEISDVGATRSDTVLIDAGYIGHGWKLNGPGTRYDGIYIIGDFETNEGEGDIHSLTWRANLFNKTGFFGEN